MTYAKGIKEYKEEETSALFTEKEITKMPKEFRKEYRTGKVTAHVRQRENGTYEIRCQYNNNKYSASGKTLEIAKERFLAALNAPKDEIITRSVKFTDYAEKWLITSKKPYVKAVTYEHYLILYNAIKPAFKNKRLCDVTATFLQEVFNKLSDRPTMANEARTLLVSLFEYAVSDGLIPISPIRKVRRVAHETEHGKALTRAEEAALCRVLFNTSSKYVGAVFLALYTGLRCSETLTAKRDGKWIIAKSAKTKHGKSEKYRKIPISPMLDRVIDYIDFEALEKLKKTSLSTVFRLLMPGHHIHDLRHTFITRCQECGIRREIVSLWAGHAADNSITSTIYTHLENNENIQLDEIKKYNYKL